MKKWMGSITVILISLITPFLVWFLLYFLGQIKVQSFDPNPLVQTLVSNPRSVNRKDSLSRWVHLVGKDGVWSIKDKDGKLSPLEKLTVPSERLVLLLDAQGPTLAMSLYHFLKDRNLIEKVIILSNSDGILKDLRFHDPRFMMSCGQAFVIRFHAMQRLSIEGLNTINMSAVYLDPKIFSEDLKVLTDYFVAHKVAVFIGPYANLPGSELEKKANFLID